MGKKYLETKKDSLESSILGVWQKAVEVTETNKNDKSDDGEGLDAVQPKAVKKKFKNRKDKDIDNDGDVDDSDKFLHKRRKAVSKAIAKEEVEIDEGRFIMTPKQAEIIIDYKWDLLRSMPMLTHLELSAKEVQDLVKKHKDLKPLFGKTAMKKGTTLDRKKLSGLARSGKDKGMGTLSPKGKIEYPRGKKGGYREEVELDEATGKEIAAKMMKDKSMKAFASKVAKMKTVSRDDLEKMLPDYVAGAAITKLFEEVDLDDNVEEYAQTAHFKIQSMKAALAKVWGMEEGHNPFAEHKGTKPHKHPHEEDEKEVVKNGKTETGKKPATINLKPKLDESNELTEGRMKELHGYIKDGKSAKEIAKIMKVDVKTIKALMDQYETHTGDGMEENGKYMEMLAAACNGASTSRPPGSPG